MIRAGTLVRLKDDIELAGSEDDLIMVSKVQRRLKDVPEGVALEKPLGGCRCWNVADLERALPAKRRDS